MKSITPRQIKATNRQLIYNYIYEEEKVSQQDLAYALHLSRPTVASKLAELEADGLIYKNGQQDSELIGRKAVGYSIVADYRVAIGVELTRHRVKVIPVDLYGRKMDRIVLEIPYENQERYIRTVCDALCRFIAEHGFRPEQLLGIGFAMQGLVSSDGTTVVYGAILGNTGLRVDCFSRYLPCPCSFIHDPEGAALTELWYSPDLRNGIYISLSRHLGGAMITNGQVRPGNHGHNATFEHIQLDPKGELCYCGKRGCLETVCSMKALLGEEEPEPFFQAVRSGEPQAARRWRTYLGHLAQLVAALHLIRDVDIILGGHLAPFLTGEDIRFLYEKVRSSIPFEEAEDYIVISKMPSHSITIGAALPYIRAFLEDIDARSDNTP